MFLNVHFEFGPEIFRGCCDIPYEHSHFFRIFLKHLKMYFDIGALGVPQGWEHWILSPYSTWQIIMRQTRHNSTEFAIFQRRGCLKKERRAYKDAQYGQPP